MSKYRIWTVCWFYVNILSLETYQASIVTFIKFCFEFSQHYTKRLCQLFVLVSEARILNYILRKAVTCVLYHPSYLVQNSCLAISKTIPTETNNCPKILFTLQPKQRLKSIDQCSEKFSKNSIQYNIDNGNASDWYCQSSWQRVAFKHCPWNWFNP